ncbi:hypothetical protein Droror1_Dr00016157 [Drosera rotundifolia]
MLLFSAAMISLFVDPVFYLLPEVQVETCIQFSFTLKVVLTIARSCTDLFYVGHVCLRLRTAYHDPSYDDLAAAWKVPLSYLRFGFWVDLAAAFPLPQELLWGILPNLKGSWTSNSKTCLMFVILIQMLLRFSLAYPLFLQVVNSSETAWVPAAYNLVLYLLGSIVSGNCWYLLAIQRLESCWGSACEEESSCLYAITVNISSGGFLNKFFYCLWWGVRNLSSMGQYLVPSMCLTEITFSSLVGALGVILYVFVIGNMQRYIQYDYTRQEKWRIKRTDLEQWMHHRQLPRELRQSVLCYHKCKWVATLGIDEQDVLIGFPTYLRRLTKRYLYLNLVRQVPLLDQLDDQTLGVISEWLKPVFYTQGMYLLYEGAGSVRFCS